MNWLSVMTSKRTSAFDTRQTGLVNRMRPPRAHDSASLFIIRPINAIWAKKPDTFRWMEAAQEHESFVIESGVIQQNDSSSKLRARAMFN